MYGAILGDMIGAPFEFDRGSKTKDFTLFTAETQFTDDTVMTIAVAEALMDTIGQSDDVIKAALIQSMQKWGKKYPYAGYGGRFAGWLRTANPQPYGSYGNGSAMRVSPAGWLFDSVEETRRIARLTAEVTHNHPEGIKGAEATAGAIFLARSHATKEKIKSYIEREFGYDLSRTCDEIRPNYHHVESCQETVPEALTAFLEGMDFEDVIRTAVSLGGDCDTLTCIAGSVAEAFFGVPENMVGICRERLSDDLLQIVDKFQQMVVPNDGIVIARKTDWRTMQMPEQHEDFTIRRCFSTEEMKRLRKGNIPQGMEDKWFWYMEGDALYAHRSWTGNCIFALRFDQNGDEIHVTVNRDPSQFSSRDIEENKCMVNRLLDKWFKPRYEYYGQWLSETLQAIEKQKE